MTFPIVETGAGTTRQVLTHAPEIMMVAFTFETDSEGGAAFAPASTINLCEIGAVPLHARRRDP